MARTWYGRRKPSQQIEIVRPQALTAAASTVSIEQPPSHVIWGGAGWQQEVWAHYDTNPEEHRLVTDMGEAFSRAVMMAVDVDPISGELGTTPTDDPVAGALIGRLFGGRIGQAQAQRQIGQHLTGPGECWVLASDQMPDVDQQTWQIIGVSEVMKAGNLIQVQNLDGTMRNLQATELLFRVWQPHPKRRWEADSPSRPALVVLREMAGFSAQIIASIKSRLASSGVWLLPDSAQLPAERDELGNELPGGANNWLRLLGNAMMTAVANPDDPSALVPIIAMIPDDVLAKIKDPFQFVHDIATDVVPLREAAVKRLAIGSDAPPERLLGVGDMNHWSAWQTDENFVKGPLSSLLSLPAEAFTTHYLRPALRLAGRNPGLFAMAFDVSSMMPDVKAQNAQAAYDAGVLSEASYLEALGFDPDRDAATAAERAQQLIVEILKKGNPESLTELEPTIKRLFPGIQLTLPPAVLPGAPATPAVTSGPSSSTTTDAPSTSDTQSPPSQPTAAPDNSPTPPSAS